MATAGEFEFLGEAPNRIFTVFAGENAERIAHLGLGHVTVHKVVETKGIGFREREARHTETCRCGSLVFRLIGGLAAGDN